MKVYIAGKITGNPGYKEEFEEEKKRLESLKHTVLNPAILPEGMDPADYMRICFAMIDCADLVVFLPRWGESKGATLEWYYCCYTGKPVTWGYGDGQK